MNFLLSPADNTLYLTLSERSVSGNSYSMELIDEFGKQAHVLPVTYVSGNSRYDTVVVNGSGLTNSNWYSYKVYELYTGTTIGTVEQGLCFVTGSTQFSTEGYSSEFKIKGFE